MKFRIRPIENKDSEFLWNMLYDMVFIHEGEEKPDKKTILSHEEIGKYLIDFGEKKTDIGFVAENDAKQLLGAAWFRLFSFAERGYGYISDDIPELSIAVKRDYRGNSIGKNLLEYIVKEAKCVGYGAISLSVDPRNTVALNLYKKYAFYMTGHVNKSWTMKKDLI